MITVEHASIGTPFATTGNGTSMALTTNVTIAAGACVVMFGYFWSSSGTHSSFANTGSSTLTWAIATQGRSANPSSPTPCIAYAMAPSGLSSGAVITDTLSGSFDARFLAGSSLLGVDSAAPLGNVATVAGSGGTAIGTWASGSVTVLDGSALVGFIGTENGGAGPCSTTHTELIDSTNGYNEPDHAVARLGLAAGSFTVDGSFTTTAKWNAVAAEFRAGVVEAPTIDYDYSNFPKSKLRRSRI